MRLVFDTSTTTVCVGLLDENGEWVRVHQLQEEKFQQSKLLFRILQNFLDDFGVPLSKIQSLAVGIGPGSYTGLRVGLTVAKLWSFTRSLPLYSFPSTKLLRDTQLDLRNLREQDFAEVENIDELNPIYENDNFPESEA